jgi:uridine kinase
MFSTSSNLSPQTFIEILFEKMKQVTPGMCELELYEFRYALQYLVPENQDWGSIPVDAAQEIEERIRSTSFFSQIEIKRQVAGKIVLDASIANLTRMLFAGLVTGQYSPDWVRQYFYFDIRGFNFLVRPLYFTPPVLEHLRGRPYRCFEPLQKQFEKIQEIGYKAFQQANAEVDRAFIECVKKLIAKKGTPILIAIAGPTAAGKTEIVERLWIECEVEGKRISTIEMDNFLTDRDFREENGIHTLGKAAIHLALFEQSLKAIMRGEKIFIPRYDFIDATSSHDLDENLKPGCTPLEIEPADIIFIEGNFPFLLEEVADLIGIKVVYLTDDEVRLKRKWRRDVDYRKKYDPVYLRNRFFKDQFLMTQKCYLPQLLVCDLAVDTTGAALWASKSVIKILESGAGRKLYCVLGENNVSFISETPKM